MTPKEIYDRLEEYVIGQESAKKIVSVAICDHLIRVTNPDLELEKSNILMIGPTGSGKTHIAKTLAKICNLPIAIADATSLTEAGYVGEDVENCLLRLLRASNMDVPTAEKGILFIDEIDKISRKSESPSITRDVSGEGVQQSLLKLIEGSKVNVPIAGGRKRSDGVGYIEIDTSNILFICSGAFVGLQDTKDITEDLTRFGMMPELLGRLPIIAKLGVLSEEDYSHILMDANNSICKQQIRLMEKYGCNVNFSTEAIDYIANLAKTSNIGARRLRSIIESILLPYKFETPSRVEITEDSVKSLNIS